MNIECRITKEGILSILKRLSLAKAPFDILRFAFQPLNVER